MDRLLRPQLVGLMDVLRAGSLNPARVLERTVPQIRNKGRIKVGADADLIVFDPAKVRITAMLEKPASLSSGMEYVLVNGTVFVDGGQLNTGCYRG
ncbi:MAG: amidohydrolase family protein [Gemmatimonadota bacterium]